MSDCFNDPLDNAFKAPITVDWMCRSNPAQHYNSLKGLIQAIESEIDTCFLEALSSYSLSDHYSPQTLVTMEELITSICNDIPAKLIGPKSIVQKINADLRSKNPSISNNLRIACFSTIKNSVPMWGYYGGNHRGMCIEFDLTLLPEDYPQKDEVLRSLRKVEYKRVRPDDDYSSVSYAPYIKGNEWAHEKEVRLVCLDVIEYIPFPCVSAIYLGVFFGQREDDWSGLFEFIVTNHITVPVYRFRPDEDKFKLVPDLININR